MAQGGRISVTPEELRNAANKLDRCNESLCVEINRMTEEINELTSGGWISRSSERLLQLYGSIHERFFRRGQERSYTDIMNAYSEFLRNTAMRYEAEEQARVERLNQMGNLDQR